jgi:hypothetical protein
MTLGFGFLGVLAGSIGGCATTPACKPDAFICFSPATVGLALGIFFGLCGVGIGLVGSLLWLLARRLMRSPGRQLS